jgi:hypothetical protein
LIECSLWAACPSQQFHSLTELITIHINISLRCADIKAILSLLHAFFISFHWKQTSFLQFSNRIEIAQPKEIR